MRLQRSEDPHHTTIDPRHLEERCRSTIRQESPRRTINPRLPEDPSLIPHLRCQLRGKENAVDIGL